MGNMLITMGGMGVLMVLEILKANGMHMKYLNAIKRMMNEV